MPRVLIGTALLWPNVVRLSRAFRDVGFDVSAVAMRKHPVHKSRAPCRSYVYQPLRPHQSLLRAIEACQPELIISCDERFVSHLRTLRESATGQMATVLERSIGRKTADAIVSRRSMLASFSDIPDVNVPEVANVASVAEARAWAQRFGLPAVLKLDHSWGGRDVVLVRSPSDVEIVRSFG